MDNLIHRFSVIKKYSSDYDCKIHEALLIKKKILLLVGKPYNILQTRLQNFS